MPNFCAYISNHNNRIFKSNGYNEEDNPPPGMVNCSCPKAKMSDCPLSRRCLEKNLVYQAIVTNESDGSNESYVGTTSTNFKARYAVHKQSFKNRMQNQTTLSKHIWDLADASKSYSLKFKILYRAKPYTSKFKQCGLCIKEKTTIITQPENATLNKRTELTAKCLHREKYLLKNVNPGD